MTAFPLRDATPQGDDPHAPALAWIDTHVHWDASEFGDQAPAHREKSAINGVAVCVIPAVERANFDHVRAWAHRFGDGYALGIHPLYTPQADEADLQALDAALAQHRGDPHLLAVGEIGLDFFVPELAAGPAREKQIHFFHQQLRLARRHGLPVILHVRRSVDAIIHGLRRFAPAADLRKPPVQRGPERGNAMAVYGEAAGSAPTGPWRGIAHAFNGSDAQAQALIALGLKLGFGGAMTYERATRLRALAATLPLDALVLETDAPDIPPQWLYRTAAQRQIDAANGTPSAPNTPAELPRIAQVLADLRGLPLPVLQRAIYQNSIMALPALKSLLSK